MIPKKVKNIAHSIRMKLLNTSRETGREYNVLMSQYFLERLMFRISQSEFADKFTLKGASLFLSWAGQLYRTTRDVDFMSNGSDAPETLKETFQQICTIKCPEDGILFDPESITALPIRDDQIYGGIRVKIKGDLAGAKIVVQVDVGFGDIITPKAETIIYPTILKDIPAPELMSYPRETVIAEKFEAMVQLGIANSRMKDFFDIWILARHFNFNGKILCKAIKNTFKRRGTEIPKKIPTAFQVEFYDDRQKIIQWKAFLRKSLATEKEEDFKKVVTLIKNFIMPIIKTIPPKEIFNKKWQCDNLNWE